jgi:hypothetical protein
MTSIAIYHHGILVNSLAATVHKTYTLPFDVFGPWAMIGYISQSCHSSLATKIFFV